jgi:hypothetical protein
MCLPLTCLACGVRRGLVSCAGVPIGYGVCPWVNIVMCQT